MREIKFRAWDKKNKYMENPESWLLITQTGQVYLSGALQAPYPAPDNQYIIMFFTGLKDKNEKEIYEGDIVQQQKDGKEIGLSEVRWWEDNLGFGMVSGNNPEYWTGFSSWQEGVTFEVIGSIYENPELLKVTKE